MTSFRSITRRDFAFSGACTLPSLAGAARSAPRRRARGQAEWRQNYDAAPAQVGARTTPVLSPATLQATEQMIETSSGIAAQGGWPAMPQANLRLGQKGTNVVALRRRLAASGDLDQPPALRRCSTPMSRPA